jgi:hypothetical protein
LSSPSEEGGPSRDVSGSPSLKQQDEVVSILPILAIIREKVVFATRPINVLAHGNRGRTAFS